MKIGIDGRLIEETGVGRYIRNLVSELGTLDLQNRYILFLRKKSFNALKLPNNRWEKRLAEVPWHSVIEQFLMPWYFIQEHLDIVHIPYFNVPIFYPGKLIVTIHDLTILHFDTGKATTLPLILYKLRRLGYIVSLAVGLWRAAKILAVSKTTKQEIIDHFGIKPGKIEVTYEGVDERLKISREAGSRFARQNSPPKADQPMAEKLKTQKLIQEQYFLYVGNAYPHKNLETLLQAFQQLTLRKDSGQTISNSQLSKTKLVLVGKEDFFYRRIKEKVEELNLAKRVIFFEEANDIHLQNLYTHAIALVFPSLMEGFGLPALEALSLGCPVLCSDIPVFHEILVDHAIYFDPKDPSDIASKLTSVKKVTDHRDLLQKYSWRTMAEQTLSVYIHTQ